MTVLFMNLRDIGILLGVVVVAIVIVEIVMPMLLRKTRGR